MTKKDFELIAAVLRKRFDEMASDSTKHVVRCVTRDFADALATTNPRFDRARFIAAATGQDSTDSAGRKARYS